jgi:hypothetical protein
MIRSSRHEVGLRFSPDCPDEVKARALGINLAIMLNGDRPVIPLCDQQWITRSDECVRGWWFPLVGFKSDAQIGQLLDRIACCLDSAKRVWTVKR